MKPKEEAFTKAVAALLASEEFHKAARVACMPQSAVGNALRTSPSEAFFDTEPPDGIILEAMREASQDPQAFDGFNRALAIRLTLTEHPLTRQMRHWIAANLTGQVKRPTSNGGNDGLAGGTKRMFTALLVYQAKQFGLRPTRSIASPPLSAADAVVECLRRMGHHTTYEAVAKSWNTHAQHWMRE